MPSWFERVPKVELHVHLEGAIPHDALFRLIQKYGGDAAVPDPESLADRFRFRDFDHFGAVWTWKNGYLREYADFEWIAEAVAGDFAAQNIVYAEAFYSPGDFAHHGLEAPGITRALRRGLDRVGATRVALVADVVRNRGPERAAETIEQVAALVDEGVVGIGLGGSEPAHPPAPFRAAFERARKLGLRTTAHAGEASGARSIWGAIRELEVDRIGHATRAEEDAALLDELARAQIPLELCPLSNVRTGIVRKIEDHPIRRYFDRGLRVCVNTDDPKLFQTSLAEEYATLESRLGFTRSEIRGLILSAVSSSWLAPDARDALAARLVRDPAWLDDRD